MTDDWIRRNLAALIAGAHRSSSEHGLTHGCLPGAASADRSEPAARQWLRRWRPARAAAAVPVCSCTTGRCVVCN